MKEQINQLHELAKEVAEFFKPYHFSGLKTFGEKITVYYADSQKTCSISFDNEKSTFSFYKNDVTIKFEYLNAKALEVIYFECLKVFENLKLNSPEVPIDVANKKAQRIKELEDELAALKS